MLIDRYSHCNRWSGVHPAEKGLFALAGLVAALLGRSPWPTLGVGLLMGLLTVAGAGVPLRFYLRLLLLPAGFLLVGVAGLAFSLSGGEYPLFALPLLDRTLCLSQAGLVQAALVFCRSLAAVCSLYLLALTTPMNGILSLLRRLRVPVLLLELAVIAHRQLFVFLEVARQMHLSQSARLGYAGYRNGMRSLGLLGANLFLRAHTRSRQLHRSLLARGYDGELRWLDEQPPLNRGRFMLVVLGGTLLVALVLYLGGAG